MNQDLARKIHHVNHQNSNNQSLRCEVYNVHRNSPSSSHLWSNQMKQRRIYHTLDSITPDIKCNHLDYKHMGQRRQMDPQFC